MLYDYDVYGSMQILHFDYILQKKMICIQRKNMWCINLGSKVLHACIAYCDYTEIIFICTIITWANTLEFI